jgi:TonB family protein
MRLIAALFILFISLLSTAASACPTCSSAELPVPISSPVPSYSPYAKAKKVSGAVLVDVTVNAEGKVIEASIISGPDLFRKDVRMAALHWRFKPLRSSEAITVRLTFIFHEISYVRPEKEPDFKCPYQVEIEVF